MTPHASLSSSSSLSSQPRRASPTGQGPPPTTVDSAREERISTSPGGLPPLVGIAGYLLHGLVFLSLAIVTLVCFGERFWLFSSVNVVLALYSIYKTSAALRSYWRLSRREP
jgi:hypothetical protein